MDFSAIFPRQTTRVSSRYCIESLSFPKESMLLSVKWSKLFNHSERVQAHYVINIDELTTESLNGLHL